MPTQTVLPVDNARDVSLNNFFGAGNQALVVELAKLIAGDRPKRVLYLWGEDGSGKSHLLNACCHEFAKSGKQPAYIALAQQGAEPESLLQLSPNTLVCLDDLHLVASDRELQVQLLGLYERLGSGSGKLVVSGRDSLPSLNLALNDLSSRLSSGGMYRVVIPDDEEKRAALKARASGRGFSLDDNVVNFIMSHYQRDMPSLFGLLDRLDSASLEAQRKITIPFVRQLL